MVSLPHSSPDIVVIGTGIGGATVVNALAASGAQILVLERGERLTANGHERDAAAIFVDGVYRSKEHWFDGSGRRFNPRTYYYVGGNSKFFGAVMIRFRRQDFEANELPGGLSPAWPFSYDELEPWYGRAEALYQVRGRAGEDPTEPSRSTPYPYAPVPDEPPIAAIRAKLAEDGLHPFSLPLAVDHVKWLSRGQTPWDAFPNTDCGKMDAETCALVPALASPSVTLETGACVERLEAAPDGRRVAAVVYRKNGEIRRVTPKLVVLAAGAVNSSVLLLRSADDRDPNGLANGSGMVGRNFMNHNATALLAVDPRRINDSIYQKTIGFNDFYLDDRNGGGPLGNVQLLGKINGTILKSAVPAAPRPALDWIARRSVDWYLMSEDLPDPDSRVRLDGDRIVLDWRRTNWAAHESLIKRMRTLLRAAGYPIVLRKTFDHSTPSHQCGTVRIGTDPASAPLDPWCRAFDHPNLFVVDGSFLPTSAAVNPALTIAAQALRVADHIAATEVKA